MSYRFMRMLIFFDLPMESHKDKQIYQVFRRNLIKSGFFMMQKSVYSRIVLNASVMNSVKAEVKSYLPSKGLVQLLCISEKQYAGIDYLVGEKRTDVIDSDERSIEL